MPLFTATSASALQARKFSSVGVSAWPIRVTAARLTKTTAPADCLKFNIVHLLGPEAKSFPIIGLRSSTPVCLVPGGPPESQRFCAAWSLRLRVRHLANLPPEHRLQLSGQRSRLPTLPGVIACWRPPPRTVSAMRTIQGRGLFGRRDRAVTPSSAPSAAPEPAQGHQLTGRFELPDEAPTCLTTLSA